MKTSLELLLLESKPTIYVKEDILNKIRKLCTTINTVEWSGLLLYEMEGSLQNADNVSIYLEDIIPMNIGDSVSTGFNYTEKSRSTDQNEDRHLDYIDQNENAIFWRLGLIHSHHNMKTYFSSVDDAELESGAKSYKTFLSFIVNNNMDFLARISYIGKTKKEIKVDYEVFDEAGKPYKIQKSTVVENSVVFYHDCNIEVDFSTSNPYDNIFDKALGDIIAKKISPVKSTFISKGYSKNTVSNRYAETKAILEAANKPLPKVNRFSLKTTDLEDSYSEDVIEALKTYIVGEENVHKAGNLSNLIVKFKGSSITLSGELYERAMEEDWDSNYYITLLEDIVDLLERFLDIEWVEKEVDNLKIVLEHI